MHSKEKNVQTDVIKISPRPIVGDNITRVTIHKIKIYKHIIMWVMAVMGKRYIIILNMRKRRGVRGAKDKYCIGT